MALTWAGVITILFLAAACVRGYRRGLIKELVSLVMCFSVDGDRVVYKSLCK